MCADRCSMQIQLGHLYNAVEIKSGPDHLFCAREPIGFKSGMKLEIVDKKNPSLIRPATVLKTFDYELQVLYDDWPTNYAFLIDDDNTDIR